MQPLATATSFARLTSLQARAVIAVIIGATLFFVAVTRSPLKSGYADAPSRGPGDVALYRAEVDRIHAGESYYAAAGQELRSRGYPTRSIFNWRTPLPVWLLGVLPDARIGQTLLALLGVGMWLLGFGLLESQFGRRASVVGLLSISGAMLPCLLADLFVMPELWAGVLIGLSAAAYGTERRNLGLTAALAALFFRELSCLWYVVCLLVDARDRRWRDVAAWFAGLAAYGVFFVVHAATVLPLISANDVAHSEGWVRFGAAGFVISTVQMNGWLLLLPQSVTAMYLVAALVGAAGWSGPAGQRIGLGLAGYALAFSVVGQSFNQYWGSLTAPLFALAVGAFPAACGDLWRAARGRTAAGAGLAPLGGRAL
jgi:hypothetical protein